MQILINDPGDARIAEYRNLRRDDFKAFDRTTFVAEGRKVVRRLCESGLVVRSMLVQSQMATEAARWVHDDVPVYTASKEQLANITGFDFHRGFLAIGERPPMQPSETLVQHLRRPPVTGVAPVVIAPVGVQDRENFGSILRSATAFGIRDCLLSRWSADPFARRVVRTSMGTVFRQTMFFAEDLDTQLPLWTAQGIRVIATTPTDALPMQNMVFDNRPIVLMIGHEGDGLHRPWIEAASDRVCIPIANDTDSLNASVAAAILMHHFTVARIARPLTDT